MGLHVPHQYDNQEKHLKCMKPRLDIRKALDWTTKSGSKFDKSKIHIVQTHENPNK